MGIGKLLGKPNKLWGNDRRWTSIPSRGSRNTPSRFMLQKLGISSGSYEPVGLKASFYVQSSLFKTNTCRIYIIHVVVRLFTNIVDHRDRRCKNAVKTYQ